VTEPFLALSRGTQQSQGLTDMCFVVVPHPLGMIPAAEVNAKIEKAFNEIVTAATQWKASETVTVEQEKPYPAKRVKFTGTYAELNSMFFNRKWAIGLPIIPPTPDKVEAMLKGAKHKPDEVVWVVPPRQGMLTVELVAALGVMAGAKPEHMPLLLATIEAFKKPETNWRGTSTTTAPTVPIIIISGPILDKLGITSGTGVSGAEQPVTNALGYFINLVGDIVGGSMPPELDKSTHGTSADLVAMVFAENAKANPWKQTYAEEQGFKPTDSVVTVYTAYLGGSNIDHNNTTGKGVLNGMIPGILGSPSGIGSCFADYNKPNTVDNSVGFTVLFLCPEHADTIARDFPTKQQVKEYLTRETVQPLKFYSPQRCVPPKDLKVDENTLLPRYINPESIKIVVTGGPGKQSQIWSPFPQLLRTTSVLVEE
jgi:hypothetical protein